MIKENLVLYLENSIKYNWTMPAFSDYKGDGLTYGEVAEKIAEFHILFEQLGIKQGDKISLIGKNSTNWVIIYLATITYGAVIVPILADFKPHDIQNIVNHSDSIVLFAGDQIIESINLSEMPNIRIVFSLTDFEVKQSVNKQNLIKNEERKALFNEKYPRGFLPQFFYLNAVSNESLAAISYTSGTTGFTKGVMLAHNSLAANIRFAQNNMPLKSGDKIVSFLPLAHAYGCAFEFLFPFSLGCHVYFLTKTPSPQIIIQAFGEIKPRLILSVPLIIEKIYKKQILPIISKPLMKGLLLIPGVQSIIYQKIKNKLNIIFGGNFHEIVIGGAAFNTEAEEFFKRIKFPFTVGYGMTECGPLISYSPWDKTPIHSAGKLVDTLEVKIDSGDPYNEVGEIQVRGENVMLGYYKNEVATQAAIDKDGWFRTGDLGILDRNGNIYIKGRNKAMILGASGQNIYPEEIESLLNNKFGIMESLIVEDNGLLKALIYPDVETLTAKKIDEKMMEEIMKHHIKEINHLLPVYMNIAKYSIHNEEFEKTPKRSIKRFLYTAN